MGATNWKTHSGRQVTAPIDVSPNDKIICCFVIRTAAAGKMDCVALHTAAFSIGALAAEPAPVGKPGLRGAAVCQASAPPRHDIFCYPTHFDPVS
jgi:hypothetical protein